MQQKTKKRYKSEMIALCKIQKYQKAVENLIFKMIFKRLVRKIVHDCAYANMLSYDYCIQRSVLSALQEVTENFMCFFMKSKCITFLHYHSCCRIFIDILLYADINLMTIHVKCIIIQDRNMRFMKNLMMNLDVMFFKTD